MHHLTTTMDYKTEDTIKKKGHSDAGTITDSVSNLKPQLNMAVVEESNSKMNSLGSEQSIEKEFERPVSKLSGGFSSVSESQLPAYSDITTRSVQMPNSFTVEKTVEEEVHIEEGPSVFNVILKWIFALFLFSVMLFCLVASKVTLLLIGVHYDNLVRNTNSTSEVKIRQEKSNETNKNNGLELLNNYNYNYNKESIFILLAMIMMIPQLLSFLIVGFRVVTKKRALPGPTTSAALWILVGSLVEVGSLCYLTIVVLTVMDVKADVMLLLMNCVFLVPSIWQLFRTRLCSEGTKTSRLRFAMFAIAALCQIVGLLMLCFKIEELHVKIGAPVAVFLLSASWSPKIRKLQTEPRRSGMDDASHDDGMSDYTTINDPTITTPDVRKRAQLKATAISSFIKFLITPFVAALFAKYFNVVDLTKLKSGFSLLTLSNPTLTVFLTQIFASLGAYCFGLLACKIRMQRMAFALPLTLATPVAIALTKVTWLCDLQEGAHLKCRTTGALWYTLVAAALLILGEFLCSGYYVWKNPGFIMADAVTIFRFPSYNGVLVEQYLMLNRRNSAMDKGHVNHEKLARDTALFMCTTMYHEADFEMEQLLHSIGNLDRNRHIVGRHLESHIFFDGCLQGEVMNEYVLTLCSLLEKKLRIKLANVVKMKTPYGMQMRWKLPGGTDFTIHLKDNKKVKNKKRWSQVMYMSYILDHREKLLGVRDENSFVLTTDADVEFTHESVEALMDVLLHNIKIGAVCGRTHPLGNGPVVWYQMFDYAIGHWLLKVANHVFGSVLCCPGCFSVFRTQAIRDVLPTYASSVDRAFEFLTKDMGEDRWMCTLMVQKGWLLSYSAAAQDVTYCPDTFDEFYKQRRRWMPSSLANQALLVSEWKKTVQANENIGSLFMMFQVFLMLSSLIGPATVILFVTYGLVLSGSVLSNEVVSVILISLTTVGFGVICLYTSQTTQLRVAKLLTFVFAIIMCSVVIGVAEQIVREQQLRSAYNPNCFYNNTGTTSSTIPTCVPKPPDYPLPAGISTLYLAGLVGIFVITALLHPKEWFCLVNGLWYLLCLPSGYLLLTIYSICNLTDRSWGTRETGTKKDEGGLESAKKFLETVWSQMKRLCCASCIPKEPEKVEMEDKRKSRATVKRTDTASSRGSAIREKLRRKLSTLSMSSQESKRSHRNRKGRISEDESSVEGTTHRRSYETDVEPQPPPPLVKRTGPRRQPSLIRVILPTLNEDEEPPQPPPRTLTLLPELPPPRIPPRGKKNKKEQVVENVSLSELDPHRNGHMVVAQRSVSDIASNADTMSISSRMTEGGKSNFRFEMTVESMTMPIENWLVGDMRIYIDKFKAKGYDNPSFLPGVNDRDLQNIGVEVRGHRHKLLKEIERIPRIEIEEGIPENVSYWLYDMGLSQYWSSFEENCYTEPEDLEDLKSLSSKEALGELLNITKPAHLERLWKGVMKLQYIQQDQLRVRQTRFEIDILPLYYMDIDNGDEGVEYEFWEGLRQVRLLPESSAFAAGNLSNLKEKLVELRNSTLMTFTIVNGLWLMILMTLARHQNLKVFGVDVIGMSFLAVYGLIMLVQFVAMLVHRSITLLHVIARAPWTCGSRDDSDEGVSIDSNETILAPNAIIRDQFGGSTPALTSKGLSVSSTDLRLSGVTLSATPHGSRSSSIPNGLNVNTNI